MVEGARDFGRCQVSDLWIRSDRDASSQSQPWMERVLEAAWSGSGVAFPWILSWSGIDLELAGGRAGSARANP